MITLSGTIPDTASPPNQIAKSVTLGTSDMPLVKATWTTGTRLRAHRLLSGYPRIERGQRNPTKVSLMGDLVSANAGNALPTDVSDLNILRYWEWNGQLLGMVVARFRNTNMPLTRHNVLYSGYIQNLVIDESLWVVATPRRVSWRFDFLVTQEASPSLDIVRPAPTPTPSS